VSAVSSSHRTAIAFVLAAAVQSVALGLPAQSDQEPTEAAAVPEATESAAEAEHGIPFDPALVGLAGFPDPLKTSEDYARAQNLIEARLARLKELPVEKEPAKPGGPQNNGPAEDVGEGQEEALGARTAALQALLVAVKQGAALAARDRELDESLAEQKAQLANIESQGLDTNPPYTIALLDQLRTEHGLAEYSNQMADQRGEQARRQVELTARALTATMRERRVARNRLEAAENADTRSAREVDLEVARIKTLVALRQHDNALAQSELAKRERALSAAQLALLEQKIALVKDKAVFTPEALESRLAEVQSREQAILARMRELTGAGSNTAESALFQARRRLQEEATESAKEVLQERVHAREDELATAVKGAEYRGRVKNLAETARTLLKRRYTVLQGSKQNLWPAWLRETQEFLGEIGKDRDFTLAELSALRSMELALSRRIAAPDLDEDVKAAINQRLAAIKVQNQLAEEMLIVQDQVRSLAQRLRLDLDPRVSERSLAQRLEQARQQLATLWDTEIAVVQDHGIYVRDVVTALGVFTLVFLIVWLLQVLLRRRLLPMLTSESQQGEERRTLRAVVSPLIRNTSQLFVLVVAFYAAMAVSGLGQDKLREWLWTLLILAFYFQIGVWANAGVVDFFKRRRSRKERDDPSAVTGYGLLVFFIRVGIWLMVGVSVLTYFKYPVAGLIGALGVGGIAVAFAVQNILSDVFSSMAIILDKPFRVGDFIVAGETVGVIEQIGVKTTRIKSLSGERVVMSNTNLLSSCIRNYKHMHERRVVFKIGVIYQTPADKLERIPAIIAEIVRAQPRARFDRAHFFEYGDFSLVFEIVYYVYGPDYVVYMDTQQAINLGIFHRFQEEGISFAYPTQELILRHTPHAGVLT
jgi:MscS family membrane protein